MTRSHCHVYLVRHGQSEGNALRVVQGHADFPLTQIGREQARRCALSLQTTSFSACFSSDLLRAQETATIISQPHSLPVITTRLLREQNFGAFNGLASDIFERELDGIIAEHRRQVPMLQQRQRPHPEIESDAEMMWRIGLFLRSIARLMPGQNVLTVSHGSIMRSLLVLLNFASFDQLSHSAIGNCGYIVIDSDGEQLLLSAVQGVEVQTTT